MEEIKNMNTEFYHITWIGQNGTNPCYYVEGHKESSGDIRATRWKVTSFIRDGKRVKAKLENFFGAGLFSTSCKIRKLKKNPFKD